MNFSLVLGPGLLSVVVFRLICLDLRERESTQIPPPLSMKIAYSKGIKFFFSKWNVKM